MIHCRPSEKLSAPVGVVLVLLLNPINRIREQVLDDLNEHALDRPDPPPSAYWHRVSFKDDVREVEKGYECGFSLENFNDLQVGDIVEAFEIEEIAATLS